MPHRGVLRVLRDLSKDSIPMKDRLLGENGDNPSLPEWLTSVSHMKIFTKMVGTHLDVPNSETI